MRMLTPLQLEHSLCLSPESSSRRALVAGFLRRDELLRFRKAETDKANDNREAGADPKHDLPAVGFTADSKIDTSCEYVAWLVLA